MPELGMLGSERGALSSERPYRDHVVFWPPRTTVAEAGRGAVGVAQRPASANGRTP